VRLATDIRATLYQAIADLAETALWLPGRYVAEQDRAADILARMSGDLARAATALRDWPGYPLDWPSHSYAAASALATASQREPISPGGSRPCWPPFRRGRGDLLAAALTATAGDSR
jgi:hypothetical protein